MPIKKFSDEIREYRVLNKSCLTTTRFNNKTFNENKTYRESMNPNPGCLYSCPQPITQRICSDIDIFVLEMNNDTNRIVGIGLIKNEPFYNKYKIYEDDVYNVFSYIGKNRIDRSEMTLKEEQIMKVFDILCFKGKSHLKRLKGIKAFPIDMLFNCRVVLDLNDFISNIFKARQ
jgi:hypothetical protein